jgi:hypothetical protein
VTNRMRHNDPPPRDDETPLPAPTCGAIRIPDEEERRKIRERLQLMHRIATSHEAAPAEEPEAVPGEISAWFAAWPRS